MSALHLTGVAAGYGRGQDALHAVDVSVRRGERVGVVGPSGCGKSTLARVALGRLPRRAGDLWVLDQRVPARPRDRRIWRGVQGVLQEADAHLDRWRTPLEMLVRSADLHGHARPAQAAAEALAGVGLVGRGGADPATLSGGERRRLGLARVALARPRLLVADEPMAGVDAPQRDALLALLLSPPGAAERPAALVVSHDLRRVARWCDRIGVLHDGEVVERLPASALGAATHPVTRALLAALPPLEAP